MRQFLKLDRLPPAWSSAVLALAEYILYPLTPSTILFVDHSAMPFMTQKQSIASPHWCQLKPGRALVTC
jgi:hypothetical protein